MKEVVRARKCGAIVCGLAMALVVGSAWAQPPFELASPIDPGPEASDATPPPSTRRLLPPVAPSPQAIADALFEPAVAGGLTADDVARRARATSYHAAAQNQALLAAQARVDEALVAYFPRFALVASYTRLSRITPPVYQGLSFPSLRNHTLVQASLSVPLSDYVLRLSHSYAAASHSEKAAALDAAAARLFSGLEGKVAYYTWLRARAQVTVAERNLKVRESHVADARNAFQIGTSSRADVLAAEAHVAAAEFVVQQERDAVRAAEDQIRIAMHDASGRAYEIGEDLRGPGNLAHVEPELETLRWEALGRRLELRALDETAWSLGAQAKADRALLYPRVDGFAGILVADPNQRFFPQQDVFHTTWDVGIRLAWSPNDALLGAGVAAESAARARQMEMQKAALADAVKLEVLQGCQALSEANVATETTARVFVAAEESYRARREQFRSGRATSAELEDAEVVLFQAGLASVNAHANVRIAAVKLLHAIGRDVEGR